VLSSRCNNLSRQAVAHVFADCRCDVSAALGTADAFHN
jgi:hypothetical protein